MKTYSVQNPATGKIERYFVGYVPALQPDGQPSFVEIKRRDGEKWPIPTDALSSHIYATPMGAIHAAVRLRLS